MPIFKNTALLDNLVSDSTSLIKEKKEKKVSLQTCNAFDQRYRIKKKGVFQICVPFQVTFCVASAYELALTKELPFVPISYVVSFARDLELDLRMQSRSEIDQIILQVSKMNLATYSETFVQGKGKNRVESKIPNLVIDSKMTEKLLLCL